MRQASNALKALQQVMYASAMDAHTAFPPREGLREALMDALDNAREVMEAGEIERLADLEPFTPDEASQLVSAVCSWLECRTYEYALLDRDPEDTWPRSWYSFFVDADHSSLLARLLSGKQPLPHPPPKFYSRPFYALFDEGMVTLSATSVSFPDKDPEAVLVGQSRYRLVRAFELDSKQAYILSDWRYTRGDRSFPPEDVPLRSYLLAEDTHLAVVEHTDEGVEILDPRHKLHTYSLQVLTDAEARTYLE